MQWIYNSLMVTLSMYLNLPSCKIQQSFKAQRMFSLSTTFKKCSRKEAGAHYKTCVKTKVARRNHSSASELTSSSKSLSDIESSWRLVHPTHVQSCVQRRPISISPSLQSNCVHLVLCASHTKSLKNVDFYSPHRHTLGVPPSCLLTTCGMWPNSE